MAIIDVIVEIRHVDDSVHSVCVCVCVCVFVCVHLCGRPKSRTERPRKTKIGIEVAHVTRDSDTTFKVKGQGH